MSDTPETDAAAYEEPLTAIEVVGAGFARNLERVRNEARVMVERLKGQLTKDLEAVFKRISCDRYGR